MPRPGHNRSEIAPEESSGEFPVRGHNALSWSRSQFRVLVIADEPKDAAHVRDLALRSEALRAGVRCATTRAEARERLSKGLDDVCILVRSTGSRVGLELLRDAVELGWSVPVVIVTRSEDPVAERLAMSLGASDWLVRARLTPEDLERAVRNSVGRTAMTQELRESERKFRAAFDGGVEARLLVDDDGRCVDANTVARQVFCLPHEALGDLRIEAILGVDARETFASLWSARNERSEQEAMLRVRHSLSALLTYEVNVVARILPGHHLVVLRDVTEREAMRKRLAVAERMSSLGALASGMAHTINNPLQVVYTSIDLLQQYVERARVPAGAVAGAIFDEMVAEVAAAREAAERVQHVVRDLAVFTRADHGEHSRVSLTGALEIAIRLTTNTIRHRAVLVREFRAAPMVMGNEAQLTQVFVHLLLNAAHAIPEGAAGQHLVRVAVQRLDDDHVQVSVSDTGQGMSPEVVSRVFDPFFTTRPIEGAGLGLSVCHGTVTSMGGEILVESELGLGTTFRVVLPDVGIASRPSTATPLPELSAMRRCSVLVIDDDPMVCRSLTRLLQGHHNVESLLNSRDALARIRAGERFDAILCDVMMPEMSGVEFYQDLVAHTPEQAAKVVFVTGGVFSQETRSFLDAGKHRVVEKPVTQTALFKALLRVLPSVEPA